MELDALTRGIGHRGTYECRQAKVSTEVRQVARSAQTPVMPSPRSPSGTTSDLVHAVTETFTVGACTSVAPAISLVVEMLLRKS